MCFVVGKGIMDKQAVALLKSKLLELRLDCKVSSELLVTNHT